MKLALALTEEDPEVMGVEGEDPIMVAGAVIKIGTKPLSSGMCMLVFFHQEV
jgi:hypothetical protein